MIDMMHGVSTKTQGGIPSKFNLTWSEPQEFVVIPGVVLPVPDSKSHKPSRFILTEYRGPYHLTIGTRKGCVSIEIALYYEDDGMPCPSRRGSWMDLPLSQRHPSSHGISRWTGTCNRPLRLDQKGRVGQTGKFQGPPFSVTSEGHRGLWWMVWDNNRQGTALLQIADRFLAGKWTYSLKLGIFKPQDDLCLY